MELEQPKEESVPAQPSTVTPSQSKRPDKALYTPKKRQEASQDKGQAQGGVKPKPRPRYTDKARKNAKNKKNKAQIGDEGASDAGRDGSVVQNGNTEADGKGDRLQDAELQSDGQPASTNQETDTELTSRLEVPATQEEEEESWDTLFNDDGDCLDPHLLEEVSAER